MPEALPGMPDPPDALTRRTGLTPGERHDLGDHRSCQAPACEWAAHVLAIGRFVPATDVPE
jgi:hypothetical protein